MEENDSDVYNNRHLDPYLEGEYFCGNEERKIRDWGRYEPRGQYCDDLTMHSLLSKFSRAPLSPLEITAVNNIHDFALHVTARFRLKPTKKEHDNSAKTN